MIKKNVFLIFFVTIFAILTIIFDLTSSSKEEYNDSVKSKYLIDVWIENKQPLKIDSLQMGIVLSDSEEIINNISGKYVQKDIMHFTINYSPDSIFFLTGTSDGKKITPCYFTLNDYSNESIPQSIYFHIDDYAIYKVK